MELNLEAWERWSAYRKVIKKPIKPVSEEAAKLKLMRFGDKQSEVVDQSIANSWQGLFALQERKADGPPKKTKEQQDASLAQFEYLNRESSRRWDDLMRKEPHRARLLIAEAELARFDVQPDQSSLMLAEQRQWHKERVGQLLSECTEKAVFADHTIRRMVLRLFLDAGLRRMDKRLQECA